MNILRGNVKMVKSFLLGTAAGFVAVSGVQAADLPAKAQAVQYVKICSLYGEGFYSIPGTETCVRFGGYVRADYGYNVAGGRTPLYSGAQGAQDRTVGLYSTRHRGNLQLDTRTQTDYGVLRTLESVHIQSETESGVTVTLARAVVQWAGFTFGHSRSLSDTFGLEASWHPAAQQNHADTGANGVNMASYTFQLGNGVMFNVGIEERRSKAVANLSVANTLRVGADPVNSQAGQSWPDPQMMFRIEQDWGYWSAAVAGHNVAATYYAGPGTGPFAGTVCLGAQAGTTKCGHPNDKVGWTIMQGGELKLPFIAPGDRAGYFFHYGRGATGYSGGNTLGSADLFGSGNKLALGWIDDGVFVNGSRIELTTAWTAAAAFEHNWSPTWRSDLTGAYTAISYSPTAKTYFSDVGGCTPAGINHGATKSSNVTLTNCNPDWQFFQGGLATWWTPIDLLQFGAEVVYTRVFTAFAGSGAINANAPGARPTGAYNMKNEDSWAFIFRIQRSYNTRDRT